MTNRKFAYCKNGHRSTVPFDAFSTDTASTHSCPICGRGVMTEPPPDDAKGDYTMSCGIDPMPSQEWAQPAPTPDDSIAASGNTPRVSDHG